MSTMLFYVSYKTCMLVWKLLKVEKYFYCLETKKLVFPVCGVLVSDQLKINEQVKG